MPKVSYIMHLSRRRFYDQTIRSVKKQTLVDWELIIADKDRILTGEDDPRMRIFDARGMLEGDIMEKIIGMARADIILHICDDDVDLPHRAQFIYDQMQATGADIICCSYNNTDEHGNIQGPVILEGPFDIKEYIQGGLNMPLFSGGYRKSTCPPWRKSFYVLGDYCFFTDAYIRGLKIIRSPEIVANIRHWDGQVSNSSSDRFLKVWWDAERVQFANTYNVRINR